MTDATYLHSSFFEQLVEHVFISELLQEAWYGLGVMIEVLRSEADASGFDVVLECNGIVRHVQLKTSRVGGARASQNVNIALARKPSGCVIWLVRDEDGDTCRTRLNYLFFGAEAGKPLPPLLDYKIARHTKGDSTGKKNERPNIRVVPKRKFEAVPTTRQLIHLLFGLSENTVPG